MLFLNLKNYPESSAANLPKLLEAGRTVQAESSTVPLHFAPNHWQLTSAHENYPELQLCAQHVDAKTLSKTTGWLPAELLKSLGVDYAIYNHSEHRVWSDTIVEDIKQIQAAGVRLVVCVENEQEAEQLLPAEPFAIALEIKELIGSGQAISIYAPDSVRNFIQIVKGKTKGLIGAGVNDKEDVVAGLALGAEGFLLASAFVKAADPAQALRELISGYST